MPSAFLCPISTSSRDSVHRRPAAAPLVLLPGAARARIVPPDLGSGAPRFRSISTRPVLRLVPEVPICLQQPSRHVSLDVFPLVGTDRHGDREGTKLLNKNLHGQSHACGRGPT